MTRYATLDLPLASWDGEHSGVAPATIIHDIAPHLAHVATFAVHRGRGDGERKHWQCTHVETGLGVGHIWHKTRESAIDAARIVLATKTPADITAAMRLADHDRLLRLAARLRRLHWPLRADIPDCEVA